MERLRSNGSILPVFTTTEASALTKVSVPRLIRACSAGKIAGYTVPYSDQWHIPARELIAFCLSRHLPHLVPSSREILIVTNDDIRERVRALLEMALDSVTIFVGTPDETDAIEGLQEAKPVLVTYRQGDGTKHYPHHHRVSANGETILQHIRQDTLLRCDVYEGNGHAKINV